MKHKLIIAISGILAVALVATSIFLVAGPEPVEATTEQPKVVAEAEAEEVVPEPQPNVDLPTWHFYNFDLQFDEDEDNDFNFGPAPETTDKESEALFMDAEFRTRIQKDPALGAADMAWFDANLGTRYLGVFYDECDEEWPKAINEAKEAWIANRADYESTLDAFFKYLDSAEDIAVREVKGLTDQMYMNPYTKDEVPDVIVMETDEHTGKFLVYTFKIKKTKKVEVMYRLECGFQPTNVAEILKVKPQKRVSGGGGIISGGGKKPGPGPTPTPTPTPKPTPTPRPKKDPKEGTKVLPNDDPGPGENTNNPDDPDHSKKDNKDNSTNLTQEEYDDRIDEIKDANSGGDGPSTPPPSSDTKQDSNESKVDSPTEKQDSSVSDDKSGGSWDGPPD